MLQDFSIFFPFITEEIYQELYHQEKSIHLTEIEPLNFDFKEEVKNGDEIINIISEARGEKSNCNKSLKTPISILELSVDCDLKEAIEKSSKDFKATLFIEKLILEEGETTYKIDKIELSENDN